MTQSIRTRVVFRFFLAVHACVVGLSFLSGCNTLDLRGDSAAPNELSNLARQARPVDPSLEPFTFSNKARAIEADLGVGQTTTPRERP
jgi:hypothetical protein